MNDIVATISRLAIVPDPLVSEEQADKYHHHDLDARNENDLRRELSFLRWFNYLEESAWHQDREQFVARALRQRHERHGGRTAA